jgi:hypothetical protein
MRSGKSPLEFLKIVAKKKPQLQELVDNVFKMTHDEIDALSQPLWIRDALKSARAVEDRDMYVKARLAQAIAADEEAKSLPKPTYEVRVWDSAPAFIGGAGYGDKEWKIEVNTGDSFLIADDEFVRFGDSVLRVGEFERYPMFAGSKFIGYMTLDNYKGFHRALLNQKHP